MKKNEVTVKCKMETEAVGDMLSDIVNCFRQGKVVIQKGQSFVTLKPAGQIEVELTAAEKKGKQKVEIQLNWKEDIVVEQLEEDIRISGDEPAFEGETAAQDQTESDAILFRKW